MVIKACIMDLHPDTRKKLLELQSKDCKQAGKQKEINKIINSCVSRAVRCGGKIKPKQLSVNRMFEKSKTDVEGTHRAGMAKPIFIGTVFAGNRELFEEAKDMGACWQDEAGDWFYDIKYAKKESSQKDTIKGEKKVRGEQRQGVHGDPRRVHGGIGG